MHVPAHWYQLEVSEEKLMKHTAEIARWVRLSGSEEEAKALAYIQSELNNMGAATTLLKSEALISLPQKAGLWIDGEPFQCITHSMSASTGDGGIQGELVYVQDGLPENYAGVVVRSKLVLVEGMAMPGKVKTARENGAAGAVFIGGDLINEMIVSPVWGAPTPETASLLPDIPVVSVNRSAGMRIKEKLANGQNTARMETAVLTGWRQIPTLVAEIKGHREPEKFVMVSGHVDSWHYGAMDNGSANATMLEIARLACAKAGQLLRSLRIVFWSGHSHGRYAGSSWYADNYWEDLHKNCVVHINVDSTGGKGATVLSEAHAMAETKGIAAEVIKALTGEDFSGTRFGRAGDQSFWGHGISSLFMSLSEQPPSDMVSAGGFAQLIGSHGGKSGGLGWWWHTPEDTLDKIDPANLVRDTKIYAVITLHFCSSPILPLDFRPTVDEIVSIIKSWQEKAGELFDLNLPLRRAEELVQLVSRMYAAMPRTDLEYSAVKRFNDTLIKLGRALVPLNYTRGNPFENDLALTQPAIPVLEPITALARATGDERMYILTSLVRRRNYVIHALGHAVAAVRDLLSVLSV
ncbi:MAG: M28 family peptidase [Bacillota bacterium]